MRFAFPIGFSYAESLSVCVCGGGRGRLTPGEGHRCGLPLHVVLSLVTFVSSLSRVLLVPLPTWKLNTFKLSSNNRKSDASTYPQFLLK